MSISLANSFRLRNKIKEKISNWQSVIFDTDIYKDIGTEEEVSSLDGMKFKDAVERVNLLMKSLMELNTAIEKANQVNKKNLIMLETIKANIAFYEKLNGRLRTFTKNRFERNETGGYTQVETEPIIEQTEIIKSIKNLKKQKDDIEEQLASSNFKTTVEIDEKEIMSIL